MQLNTRGAMRALAKLISPSGTASAPTAATRHVHTASHLALYHYPSCPFCVRVRRELARLDATGVELRNIHADPEHRAALKAGGGRVTVPCLRITGEDGSEAWLYESADIVAWLRQHFQPDPADR